jgi:hypothetical protein
MQTVTDAIESACAYLLRRQRHDGHWEDYDLPTGRSDAWVTAYVGLALSGAARQGLCGDADDAAGRAAAWLAQHRAYAAGWGYNGGTGADADSTGYALRLLRAVGQSVRSEDEDWLLAHWRPQGGFATYATDDGWGLAHPDVTPVAFAALSPAAQQRLRDTLRRVMLGSRDSDGTWPSYWWRTRHYSTYVNARLALALGLDIRPAAPAVSLEIDRTVHSAFDLAFVAANAALHDAHGATCRDLTDLLLRLQESEGHWEGAANLRVTRHDAADPWHRPEGALYVDIDHLITTASAVVALTELHDRCQSQA